MEPDRGKRKVNWLLCSLIGVSLVLHAGVLLYLSKGLSSEKVSCIEVSMLKEARPRAREIPRPHLSRAVQDNIRQVGPNISRDLGAPDPKTLLKDLKDIRRRDSALARSAVSDMPADVPVKVHTFSPPARTDTGGFGSRMDYLNMVRLKIEGKKRYPAAAQNMNLEGRVMVGFVIGLDGGALQTEVVTTSGHPLLDQAALDAVRRASPFPPPPKKLFKSRVKVSIPITFKLLR